MCFDIRTQSTHRNKQQPERNKHPHPPPPHPTMKTALTLTSMLMAAVSATPAMTALQDAAARGGAQLGRGGSSCQPYGSDCYTACKQAADPYDEHGLSARCVSCCYNIECDGDKRFAPTNPACGHVTSGAPLAGGILDGLLDGDVNNAVNNNNEDIVALAAGDADLSTLVVAVKHAGLVSALEGKGPFTVFAPTNEAFAKLPAAALKELLQPQNVGKLKAVLTYHVVSGSVHAKDLRDGEMVTTLEGQKLRVTINRGGVFIDGAKVTTADVDASNGVVHIIDSVLLPPKKTASLENFMAPEKKDIVALAAGDADLSTLVVAVKHAGLVSALEGKGPFTVFAPTNEAFAKLPAAALKELLQPQNVGKLKAVLTYHVVSGSVHAKDLRDGEMVTTLEGQKLRVTINRGGVFIDGAKVTTADVDASNGVVHIIDSVLLPPKKTASLEDFMAPEKKDIVALAAGDADLSTLVAAVKDAGLVSRTRGQRPVHRVRPDQRGVRQAPRRCPQGTPSTAKRWQAQGRPHLPRGVRIGPRKGPPRRRDGDDARGPKAPRDNQPGRRVH